MEIITDLLLSFTQFWYPSPAYRLLLWLNVLRPYTPGRILSTSIKSLMFKSIDLVFVLLWLINMTSSPYYWILNSCLPLSSQPFTANSIVVFWAVIKFHSGSSLGGISSVIFEELIDMWLLARTNILFILWASTGYCSTFFCGLDRCHNWSRICSLPKHSTRSNVCNAPVVLLLKGVTPKLLCQFNFWIVLVAVGLIISVLRELIRLKLLEPRTTLL